MRIFPFPTADVDIDSFTVRATRVGPDEWILHLETNGLDVHTTHPVWDEYTADVTKLDVWAVMSVLERIRIWWSRPERGPF